MTISNLFLKFSYQKGVTGQPLVIILQGWSGKASDYLDTFMDRLAAHGYFVAAVGMRGRDGASGSRDASGRELHDIYDAVQYIRSHYSVSTKTAIMGNSGGGGNVLGACCKFPDLWATAVDFYGISDYGRDATNGWYQNNGGTFNLEIEASVGGIPTTSPDKYYARDATAAITNYSGGGLVIFHDESDTTVPIIHTTRIKNALDIAGITYTLNQSKTGDAVRWSHGHAQESDIEYAAEKIWMPLFDADSEWTIPASGTITVIGYIVTKRFSIWLNSGLDAAATVVYDTVAGTYTVTPLTSNAVVAVSITQGTKTASGNTNGETLFTVA